VNEDVTMGNGLCEWIYMVCCKIRGVLYKAPKGMHQHAMLNKACTYSYFVFEFMLFRVFSLLNRLS